MNFREAADKLLMHLLDAVKTCQKVRFFYLIFEERSTQCKEFDISFLGSLKCSFLPLQRRVSSRNNNIENIEVTSMSGLAGQQSKRLSAILEKSGTQHNFVFLRE